MPNERSAHEEAAVTLIRQRYPDAIVSDYQSAGQRWLFIKRDLIFHTLKLLKEEADFSVLLDVTVVDRLPVKTYRITHDTDFQISDDKTVPGEPVFEVLYLLHSQEKLARLRLKVKVDRTNPRLPSVVDLWPSANWFEREVYDLFGIVFEGHPNLKRILMPDDWIGHPLRKDYPLTQEPEQFLGLQHDRPASEMIPKQEPSS
jgi:NADH-quinone oxidoreductase subunit C